MCQVTVTLPDLTDCPDPPQMVFYIEACESGSMMEHLPGDIDGEPLGTKNTGQNTRKLERERERESMGL